VRSWIDHGTVVVEGPSSSLVGQLVEAGQPFWLDIENPTGEIIDRLAVRLGLHSLAVEDSKQFGQRGKLQVYAPLPAFVLRLDERLDALEQRVLREADDDDLTEITAIRHQAAAMRQTLTPGRDLTSRMRLVLSLPGATPDSRVYFEDLSDELQRIVADLTAIEERCITLLGLQASLAGNHLAVVTRRLARWPPSSCPSRSWPDSGERTSTSSPAVSRRDGRPS
jgi:Mg2+ and Co2+ transporter CorA